MTITLDLRPEVQAELARQAELQGEAIETVAAALLEDAILASDRPNGAPASVVDACERLRTFGKNNGLSLAGMTIRDLRHEARP